MELKQTREMLSATVITALDGPDTRDGQCRRHIIRRQRVR